MKLKKEWLVHNPEYCIIWFPEKEIRKTFFWLEDDQKYLVIDRIDNMNRFELFRGNSGELDKYISVSEDLINVIYIISTTSSAVERLKVESQQDMIYKSYPRLEYNRFNPIGNRNKSIWRHHQILHHFPPSYRFLAQSNKIEYVDTVDFLNTFIKISQPQNHKPFEPGFSYEVKDGITWKTVRYSPELREIIANFPPFILTIKNPPIYLYFFKYPEEEYGNFLNFRDPDVLFRYNW